MFHGSAHFAGICRPREPLEGRAKETRAAALCSLEEISPDRSRRATENVTNPKEGLGGNDGMSWFLAAAAAARTRFGRGEPPHLDLSLCTSTANTFTGSCASTNKVPHTHTHAVRVRAPRCGASATSSGRKIKGSESSRVGHESSFLKLPHVCLIKTLKRVTSQT